MKEIENDSFSIYLNERETEAIIKNEPYDSKYSVLSPSFFPLFPYLLLGKIKTSFNSNCINCMISIYCLISANFSISN